MRKLTFRQSNFNHHFLSLDCLLLSPSFILRKIHHHHSLCCLHFHSLQSHIALHYRRDLLFRSLELNLISLVDLTYSVVHTHSYPQSDQDNCTKLTPYANGHDVNLYTMSHQLCPSYIWLHFEGNFGEESTQYSDELKVSKAVLSFIILGLYKKF